MEPTCTSDGVSPTEQAKIREQLDRMLGTNHFNQSRRYPALLRFLVEETLQGRGGLLKERLIGVEVFDRNPTYDTAADPIVRVTIAEVRKRIAQYYHDDAHDAELRIELPLGHYVAAFRPGKATPPVIAPEEPLAPLSRPVSQIAIPEFAASGIIEPQTAPSLAPPSPGLLLSDRKPAGAWRRAALGLVLAVVAIAAGGGVYQLKHPPALEQLWAPLMSPRKQILFCLPTDVGRHRGALTTPGDLPTSVPEAPRKAAGTHAVTFLEHETTGENVVLSDALATLRIANFLALHSREYRVRLNVTTTLDDLRQGPAILIGGLDNQWTMQALSSLRYRFAGSDDEGYWISDTQHLDDRKWSLNLKQDYAKVTRDYALIARVHDQQAGQPQMIVAGIGMSGTMAAGEFLADPQQIEELQRRLGPDLVDRDFEAVLSTDVVNGVAGAPHIVAVWGR